MTMRRAVMGVAVAGLLLVGTGCTLVDVHVTAYASPTTEVGPGPGAPIAVLVAARPDRPLLEGEVARKIARLLAARGLRAAEENVAEYALTAELSIDGGRTVLRYTPTTELYPESYRYYYTGPRGTRRTYYVQTTELGPRTRMLPETYREYTAQLVLTLTRLDPVEERGGPDRIRGRVVWQAEVITTGSESDVRVLADFLLAGGFEYFAADTGRQVRLRLSDADARVKAVRSGS